MKVLLAIIGSTMSLLLITGVAFAANVSNTNTGAGSTNNASSEIDNLLNIINMQNLSFNNLLNLNSNTGGNKANGNTGNGSITTGNVATKVSIDNNGNVITTTIGNNSTGGRGGGGGTTTASSNTSTLSGRGGGQIAQASISPEATLPVTGADPVTMTFVLTGLMALGFLGGRALRVFAKTGRLFV